MNTYKRHRFPPDIISYAAWLYYPVNFSYSDIEGLLAERHIAISREAIRVNLHLKLTQRGCNLTKAASSGNQKQLL